MLVAVVMLFVVGAMAALSIDVVTLYTARSEAQLAADGAALAAARVIANSGATSDPTGAVLTTVTSSTGLAAAIASQVAEGNQVGGTQLTATNVTVTFGNTTPPPYNPTVTVKIQANLPAFFARIWGTTIVTVSASATAEAYNPGVYESGAIPVAPICVKPWLLPNMSPNPGPTNPQIFDPSSGAILDTNLLGWLWVDPAADQMLYQQRWHCQLPPGHLEHSGPMAVLPRHHRSRHRQLSGTQFIVRGMPRLCWVQQLPVEYCGLRANANLLLQLSAARASPDHKRRHDRHSN